MIRLYSRNETSFNHNKNVLSPISCYAIEEENGMFEVECEVDKNTSLENGEIIAAPTPRGTQPFRIYRVAKTLKGKKAYARHIFYDQAKNMVLELSYDNVVCQTALQGMLNGAEYSHPFTGTSDVLNINSIDQKRVNPVQAILGDGGIISLWGGNLIRDGYTMKIKASGTYRGYEIRVGKNLVGVEGDADESNVKTRIYPYVELDDTTLMLPEKYVDSPLLSNYGGPVIASVQVSLTDEQKELTESEIFDIMRDYCADLFDVYNVDKPVINYKVNFVELSKTEQYKDIAILEQLDLYDIVSCKISQLDINVKAKVIKYKYDCIKQRNETIELGDFKSVSKYQTDNIVKQIAERLKANESAVDYATNVITGNKGGYVVIRRYPNGKPYEILIMDTEDIKTAQNVWRWNQSGFGHSENGYNGPYDTAITIDGHVVADFIDTGTLSTVLIKSADDTIAIDLANGTFTLRDNNGEALITPNGVANSDNFSMTENIQDGYPLSMPFNIDEQTSIIKKVLLKYTQQSFRTYSTTTESAGGFDTTLPYSAANTTYVNTSNSGTSGSGGGSTGTTGNLITAGADHVHEYMTPSHTHNIEFPVHQHNFPLDHQHIILIDPHNHELNFGIMEKDISDYSFTVYVDSNPVVSVINDSANTQGILDLTAYITIVGWHTIEIISSTLKRISAQINIKSYIRS